MTAAGSRRLDPDIEGRIRPATLLLYRDMANRFCQGLDQLNLNPTNEGEWDDIIVEYKNEVSLRYCEMARLVAGVEYFFPRYRGKLLWARSTLSAMAIRSHISHATPMNSSVAVFLACHLSVRGRPRLGLGITLQQALGLRPGEMRGLLASHVSLPETRSGVTPSHFVVIRLGVRSGTKAKREQFAMLDQCVFPHIADGLRSLLSVCSRRQPLFPYSASQHRRWLKEVQEAVGLPPLFTPHSARSGFATEAIASGRSASEVQSAGRWVSASSFRTYLDIVQGAALEADHHVRGFRDSFDYTKTHFDKYFSVDQFSREVILDAKTSDNEESEDDEPIPAAKGKHSSSQASQWTSTKASFRPRAGRAWSGR